MSTGRTTLRKTSALMLASAVLLVSACDDSIAVPPVSLRTQPAVTASVDPSSIRAQDDYYGYVNAAYLLDNLPEYGQQSSGSFAEVETVVKDELMELLDEIVSSAEDYPAGSTKQLIRDMYLQGMAFDGSAAEMERVRGLINEICAANDIRELLTMWVELSRTQGIQAPGFVTPAQDNFKSGENALFLRQLTGLCQCEFEKLAEYDSYALSSKNTLTDLLMPFTSDKHEAESLATDAVYLLLDIAFATDISVQKAANPYTTFTFISEEEACVVLSNLGQSPLKFFWNVDENPYGGYYIQDRGQFEKLNELFTNERLGEWKTLLICDLVQSELNFIATEAPSLAGYAPDASLPKEEMIAELIQEMMPNRVGKLYSQRYYTTEKDKALRDMCDTLIASYRELIGNAEWLSAHGRESLLKKLNNISFVLGDSAPEVVDPADAALIADSFPETVRRMNESVYNERKERIGNPCDLTDPRMPAQMVNACYDPANIVTITVAILHEPFFDANASDAANLGGLGMVVGHEIGHAFDSMCMDYDENGDYRPDWLGEADRKELAERADKLADYYSQYTVLDVYHVDGKLTNGENYADLGAMECITNAVHTNEELIQLFENYARIWAENTLDTSAVEFINTDVHSPAKVRVNAVLSSCNKFYDVYDVKEGDGMYKAPEERVSRW